MKDKILYFESESTETHTPQSGKHWPAGLQQTGQNSVLYRQLPVEFWIRPVDDSKNKLLEVYLIYMVFGYSRIQCRGDCIRGVIMVGVLHAGSNLLMESKASYWLSGIFRWFSFTGNLSLINSAVLRGLSHEIRTANMWYDWIDLDQESSQMTFLFFKVFLFIFINILKS